jgi:hypothetical protein
MNSITRSLCLAFGLIAFAAGASAQILIGQTAGFTGAVASGVEEASPASRSCSSRWTTSSTPSWLLRTPVS